MGDLLSGTIQSVLTFIRFGINTLFVVAIVALVGTLIVNFIMAVQGFVGLILPFENSLIRDIYLLINLWSPVNFGIIFNHVILIATTVFGIYIFMWVQRMFNDSWLSNG